MDIQDVNKDSLIVHEKNPRIFPVNDEEQAILNLCFELDEKIVVLANSIVANGLNPLDNIGVFPLKTDNSKYVVKDGNRRVAAIKLINNPSIIEKEFPRIHQKFQEINSKVRLPFMDKIPAIISPESEIDYWMDVKHEGERKGEGQVKWDPHAKDRRRVTKGTADTKYTFLQSLITNNLLSQEDYYEVNKTNFERVLTNVSLPYWGISKDSSGYNIVNQELFDLVFPEMVEQLKDATVEVVYSEKSQIEFFEKIYSKLDIYDRIDPDDGPQQTTIFKEDEKENIQERKREKSKENVGKKLSKKDLKKRINIIPRSTHFNSLESKTNHVIDELKRLNVYSFPISCTTLFRTFIELSLREFYKKNDEVDYKEKNLESMVNKSFNFLYDQSNSDEVSKRRAVSSVFNSGKLINNLHAVIHLDEAILDSESLKNTFDSLENYFYRLFAYKNN